MMCNPHRGNTKTPAGRADSILRRARQSNIYKCRPNRKNSTRRYFACHACRMACLLATHQQKHANRMGLRIVRITTILRQARRSIVAKFRFLLKDGRPRDRPREDLPAAEEEGI